MSRRFFSGARSDGRAIPGYYSPICGDSVQKKKKAVTTPLIQSTLPCTFVFPYAFVSGAVAVLRLRSPLRKKADTRTERGDAGEEKLAQDPAFSVGSDGPAPPPSGAQAPAQAVGGGCRSLPISRHAPASARATRAVPPSHGRSGGDAARGGGGGARPGAALLHSSQGRARFSYFDLSSCAV